MKTGRRRSTWYRVAFRAVTLLLGTAGLRIDRPLGQVLATAVLLAATLPLQFFAAGSGHALAVAVAAGVVYYVGNAIACAPRISASLRRRLGETQSLVLHETFLGVAFANQALALGLVAEARPGTFQLSASVVVPIAVVLTVCGAGAKYWATHLVGLDVYYYRDLFLRRPVSPLVTSGPYRFLAHPMYGLGNVHSYVPALLAGSAVGLVVAFAYHVAVYGFLFFVEKPFIDSLGTPRQVTSASPRP